MKNICAIFNISPFYRKSIFSLMDQQLDIDFYFGDLSNESISLMNPNSLGGYKKSLKNIYKNGKLLWQKDAIKVAFSNNYNNYILTGNPGIKSNWIIAVLARILGKKVWLWTHGIRGNEKPFSRFVNIIYMKLVSGLLFYNERGAAIAKSCGINPGKIHVIYNSLDYVSQKKLRDKVGDASFLRNYFGNTNPYVVFMGRLTSSKNVDMILKALKDISCNIVIVGDGPEKNNLEKLSAELGMEDRIWFYGECYDEQMNAQIIFHSSLLISPGNIGLSALHAMTYGTIPLTHDNLNLQMPEVESVIQLSESLGKQLLFKYNNQQSLTDIVMELLSYCNNNREIVREKCYAVIEDKWNSLNQINILKTIFGI